MSPSFRPLGAVGRWPYRTAEHVDAVKGDPSNTKVGRGFPQGQGEPGDALPPKAGKETMMSPEESTFQGEVVPQETWCPLSDDALALLPYTFLGLNPDGFILRAEGQTPGGPSLAHRKVIGAQFFSDLFRGPQAEEALARYKAMARSTADDRFVTPLRFVRDGEERFVELIFTYYASVGLGFVLLREPAKSRPLGG